MAIEQNFLTYQKSIGKALEIEQNRIRDLIGSSHWLTDGEHKESILRKVLKDFLPEIYRVGTGFVCYPDIDRGGDNSSQIDILITSKEFPTLYKSGELHFVTPECVNAIVEVKTKLTNSTDITDRQGIKSVLQKLSDDVAKIRENLLDGQECWAGLFVYDKGNLNEENVLKVLQEVANNDIKGVINCVSVGERMFFRFWEEGYPESEDDSHVWHSYEIHSLSMAYFIGNIVASLSPIFTKMASDALFPLSGTKENKKKSFIKLDESEVHSFESN